MSTLQEYIVCNFCYITACKIIKNPPLRLNNSTELSIIVYVIASTIKPIGNSQVQAKQNTNNGANRQARFKSIHEGALTQKHEEVKTHFKKKKKYKKVLEIEDNFLLQGDPHNGSFVSPNRQQNNIIIHNQESHSISILESSFPSVPLRGTIIGLVSLSNQRKQECECPTNQQGQNGHLSLSPKRCSKMLIF